MLFAATSTEVAPSFADRGPVSKHITGEKVHLKGSNLKGEGLGIWPKRRKIGRVRGVNGFWGRNLQVN